MSCCPTIKMFLPGLGHFCCLLYLHFSNGYVPSLVQGQQTVVPGKEICFFAILLDGGSEERGLQLCSANCIFF